MPPSDHSLFWNMALHTSLLNNPWSPNCGSGSHKSAHPRTGPSMSPLSSSSLYSLAGYSFPFTNSSSSSKSQHNPTVTVTLVKPTPRRIGRRRTDERSTPPPRTTHHYRHHPHQHHRERRVTFGSSSSTSSSTSSKKTTMSSLLPTVHTVMSLYDYTESEMEATWYDKIELRAMRQQCRDDAAKVHHYDSTSSSSNNDDCSNSNAHEVEEEEQRDDSTTCLMRRVQHEQHMEEDHECVLLLTNRMNRVSVDPPPSPPTTTTKTSTTKTTPRGLESKSSEGALRKKRHRTQAMSAVLSEQRRQRRFGIKDDEAIADAYFEVSEPCHVAANMMGMRDAREVLLLASLSPDGTNVEDDKENRASRPPRDSPSSSSSFIETIMSLDVID
jgi:hypothetical protein